MPLLGFTSIDSKTQRRVREVVTGRHKQIQAVVELRADRAMSGRWPSPQPRHPTPSSTSRMAKVPPEQAVPAQFSVTAGHLYLPRPEPLPGISTVSVPDEERLPRDSRSYPEEMPQRGKYLPSMHGDLGSIPGIHLGKKSRRGSI